VAYRYLQLALRAFYINIPVGILAFFHDHALRA